MSDIKQVLADNFQTGQPIVLDEQPPDQQAIIDAILNGSQAVHVPFEPNPSKPIPTNLSNPAIPPTRAEMENLKSQIIALEDLIERKQEEVRTLHTQLEELQGKTEVLVREACDNFGKLWNGETERRIATIEAKHQDELEQLVKQHKYEMERLEIQHSSEIDRITGDFDARIQQLRNHRLNPLKLYGLLK